MSSDDILAANQAFYRAFEKRDMDAMEQIWSQGSSSLCIHPGRDVIKGWPAIRSSWSRIFEATDYIEINPDIVTVETSDTIAYVVVVEKVLQVLGRRRLESETLATNVFERMGSHWYLIHHHGSPLMT